MRAICMCPCPGVHVFIVCVSVNEQLYVCVCVPWCRTGSMQQPEGGLKVRQVATRRALYSGGSIPLLSPGV